MCRRERRRHVSFRRWYGAVRRIATDPAGRDQAIALVTRAAMIRHLTQRDCQAPAFEQRNE